MAQQGRGAAQEQTAAAAYASAALLQAVTTARLLLWIHMVASCFGNAPSRDTLSAPLPGRQWAQKCRPHSSAAGWPPLAAALPGPQRQLHKEGKWKEMSGKTVGQSSWFLDRCANQQPVAGCTRKGQQCVALSRAYAAARPPPPPPPTNCQCCSPESGGGASRSAPALSHQILAQCTQKGLLRQGRVQERGRHARRVVGRAAPCAFGAAANPESLR